MLVGSVERTKDENGDDALYNIVALLDGGKVVATRRKHELPNYGTFDEKRIFVPGPLPDIVEWRGVKLGLPICEDGWLPKVCRHLAAQGADLLISVNGSPYEIDKDERRLTQVFASRVAETRNAPSSSSTASADRTKSCSTAVRLCSTATGRPRTG